MPAGAGDPANRRFQQEIIISQHFSYPVLAGFLSAVPTFGCWLPSGDCRPHECVTWGGGSGKTLVSWKIEVKPWVCMGEGVGCRFCLAWLNVDFRELVGNGKLLGWMTLVSHMGQYYG